jgi:hypothetical protein
MELPIRVAVPAMLRETTMPMGQTLRFPVVVMQRGGAALPA